MRIVQGLESYPPDSAPSVVALGVFDGVHLAHRAILGAAVSRARELGVQALACTFDPHPMEVLQPDRAPVPLTTIPERLDLMAETGLDGAVVIAFTRALAAMEPEAFVKDVLVGRLRAREVVVGFNHRFGRGARGDAAMLESLGERLGFRAHVVEPLQVDGVPVSSTEVRAALQRGDVTVARRFLGRPYSVGGTVVHGAGRGRTLGFPTANVRPDRPVLVPAGVYGCDLLLDGSAHPAVVNIGVRPTFGEATTTVEAHVLDFAGDMYDRHVVLRFLERLRPERKFASVEDLKAQIAEDIKEARARR
jgi:riboflavin kinase / FMN adenylyltransferase